ncbi:Bcl-2-binding component 3 [Myotis davidii]|uniref:Bcl-2-binding component 3 n=1 Tax=Myotis davidii TaxID=225400 RepID=L5LCU5_MYODS|nr:Bcl-2-binding component 3 [Myotis davidii]
MLRLPPCADASQTEEAAQAQRAEAPGSTMARARQEGSSPEPVEGLARDGPRPFPLSRLVPSAVSCGLCEPGLPPAPATPALLPAAYLCAPTALPAVTAALGAPRWPGGPRSRPRGPHPNGPQPSLSPAEQHHLESPVPSAPGALAGGPTQAAPGIRGEEEQWARERLAHTSMMRESLIGCLLHAPYWGSSPQLQACAPDRN